MKKILKLSAITPITILPISLAISCTDINSKKQQINIKDYEKEANTNNLKDYLEAFTKISSNLNISEKAKADLTASFTTYFLPTLQKIPQELFDAKNLEGLKQFLGIFDSLKDTTSIPKGMLEVFEKTKEFSKKQVDQFISLLEKESPQNNKEKPKTDPETQEPNKQKPSENGSENSKNKDEQKTINFTIVNEKELQKALDSSDKPYINLYFNPENNTFSEHKKEIALLSVPEGTPELKGISSDGKKQTKSIKVYSVDYHFSKNSAKDVKVKDGYVVVQYVLNDKIHQVDLKLTDNIENSDEDEDDEDFIPEDSEKNSDDENEVDNQDEENSSNDDPNKKQDTKIKIQPKKDQESSEQKNQITFTINNLSKLKEYIEKESKKKGKGKKDYINISLKKNSKNVYEISKDITLTIPQDSPQLKGFNGQTGKIDTKSIKLYWKTTMFKNPKLKGHQVTVDPNTAKIEYSEDGQTLKYFVIDLSK
ncbi:Uncharacterised protein [Mycoplasmopsis citelli]|uniref:Lipoprotein n=1 Tax=Mycoplasmopsis citelli TaxID=171281 RepID=A0A449B231_9BACT|nr:hypothetical protein [Mycoplasmopsis citelli]VEU74652.1 Uncharacterised protein [Mycoplasmopsis citelli]